MASIGPEDRSPNAAVAYRFHTGVRLPNGQLIHEGTAFIQRSDSKRAKQTSDLPVTGFSVGVSLVGF